MEFDDDARSFEDYASFQLPAGWKGLKAFSFQLAWLHGCREHSMVDNQPQMQSGMDPEGGSSGMDPLPLPQPLFA